MKKNKTGLAALLAGSLLFGCEDPNSHILDNNHKSMAREMTVQLDAYVNNFTDIPGAWLHVEISGNPPIQLTSGLAQVTSPQQLQNSDGLRSASITKMFTATIIMQLHEREQINLQDAITDYIAPSILQGLHSEDALSQITILNLLQHTSGIEDYVALNWIPTLLQDPGRFWQPTQLLDYVKGFGMPQLMPGTGHYYADTNYVLLGLIIEKITDMTLHQAYASQIFKPLKMEDTFLEAYEKPNNYPLASGYFGEMDLSNWSTSSDWGGGGLISTMEDLGIFMRKLVGGELFENPDTFQLIQQWLRLDERAAYGLGIGRYKIGQSTVIGHGGQGFGFTSGLYYYPKKDAVIFLGVNQQSTDISGFEEAVVDIINRFN